MINRRELLVGGASSVALAGLAPASLIRAAWIRSPTRADFEPLLGSRLRLLHQASYTWGQVELVEIIDGPADPGLEQFTLLLRNQGQPLPDGTYWVINGAGDFYVLYLELTGDDASGAAYHVAPFALLL